MARLCHLRYKEQYNVTQCNYKGLLALFLNKAMGL